MADLSLVTTETIHVVDADVHAQITSVAEAAIVAGNAVTLDATTGKVQKADSDTETAKDQIYIALRNAAAGEAVTCSKHAVIEGFDLSGLNYGAPVYLSDTAGALADAAASGSNSVIVGRVEPVFSNGATADRVLRFCTLTD